MFCNVTFSNISQAVGRDLPVALRAKGQHKADLFLTSLYFVHTDSDMSACLVI